MGNKLMKRFLAVVMALAMIVTSGIGVFAASGSPTVGKVTKVTSDGNATCTKLTVTWKKSGNADSYIVKVGSKSYPVKGKTTYTATVKKGSTYKVTVTPVYKGKKGKAVSGNTRWMKTTKITKVTNGKKKVTLKWNKTSGATKYQILQYKGGSWKVVKTVKGTKTTITKLKKGSYKFKVRPCKGSALGVRSNAKTGKAK